MTMTAEKRKPTTPKLLRLGWNNATSLFSLRANTSSVMWSCQGEVEIEKFKKIQQENVHK